MYIHIHCSEWLLFIIIRDEKEKIGKELRIKSIQLLDEKSKSLSLESQLRSLETDKQKLYSKIMKLSLSVEELQLKYEPGNVTLYQTIKIYTSRIWVCR